MIEFLLAGKPAGTTQRPHRILHLRQARAADLAHPISMGYVLPQRSDTVATNRSML